MRKILFCALLAAVCHGALADDRIRLNQQQIDHLGIQVQPLVASQNVHLLYAPAKVVVPPNREVLVGVAQSGLLTHINASAGDTVKAGQVLATLQSPALVELQTQYLKALNDGQLVQTLLQRDKRLLADGIIPERRLQETQNQYAGTTTGIKEAEQLLIMAGMSSAEIKSLASTRRLSQQLSIRSPIDGVILERTAVIGDRPDMLAPLFLIANLDQLWLEINIPQERAHDVHIGDRVEIENTAIAARISLLGQSINRQNQTVLARAEIDGRRPDLRAGQNVSCKILQPSAKPVFKLPNSALIQSEGHHYVFVSTDTGFTVTAVDVVGKQDEETLIGGALTGNERIAIKGTAALKANWLGLGGDAE